MITTNAASIALNGLVTEIDDEPWVDLVIDAYAAGELMDIYVGAFIDDELDEMPPIVAQRCTECFMLIDEFEEHHCIRR